MKKWTRWEDWVAIAAGLAVVLATMFVTHAGASLAMMLVLGILLIASGIVNLAWPGLVAMEYVQGALGLLLVISPWVGGYAGSASAHSASLKPTSRRSPTSSTGRLIIDGCASISSTALASSIPCRSASGSLRKVVPARLSSRSQPSSAAHPRSRASSMPAVL